MCTPPMQPTQPPFLWLGDVSLFRCELLTACQVGAFSLSESASSVQSNSVFSISFLHILSSFHLFATCQPDKLFQFFPFFVCWLFFKCGNFLLHLLSLHWSCRWWRWQGMLALKHVVPRVVKSACMMAKHTARSPCPHAI